MKKRRNLYYKAVFQRRNHIKMAILNFFLAISSWPRLVLEVFLRRNFGERYFSIAAVITVFTILLFGPSIVNIFSPFSFSGHPQYSDYAGYADYSNYSHARTSHDTDKFVWYAFMLAFLGMSLFRYSEVITKPGVYDFARFSLSEGDVHPAFYRIKINGKELSRYVISTVVEPGLCLVIGLILAALDLSLGKLLIFCSIVYSLSQFGAYAIGNDFIMDKIDERICSEELAANFVEGRPSSETRGFNAYGRRPADIENRRKLTEDFFGDDDDFAEVR